MKNLEIMREYIQKHYQMVIATYGKYPWIATVYYSVDSDLHIYFLSDPLTIHCQQIVKNPDVAISISDSPQNPGMKKKGIQIYGQATRISGERKITHAVNLWKKTLGVKSDLYSYQGMMKKAIKGRMYKVVPKKIKFFNEELWEEGTEPMVDL